MSKDQEQASDNLQQDLEQTDDNLQQDQKQASEISQKTDVSDEDIKREPEPPANEKETKSKLPVDYGQSSPEDADMYTTRN